MNASRSLNSFIAGGVIGAGVALLCAPQSGPATRAYLRRKSRDLAQASSDLKRRLFARSEELRDEVVRFGRAVREGVATELDDAAREVDALGESVRRPAGY